jgi:hypothetical protein
MTNEHIPRKDEYKTDAEKDAWQMGFNVFEAFIAGRKEPPNSTFLALPPKLIRPWSAGWCSAVRQREGIYPNLKTQC